MGSGIRYETKRCFLSARGLPSRFLSQKEDPLIPYYNPNDRRRPEKRNDPINERIRYPEVLVIGPNGEQMGVMSAAAANQLAASYDLDLYCVAPNANPPVCKIVNYGKLRYEKQKQEKASKKNQHITEIKQVQLTPQIGGHDFDTKARKAKEFIEEGDKVQAIVFFRGRQLSHKEVGEEVLARFIEALAEVATLEKEPYWEGKRYSAILAPKKKK